MITLLESVNILSETLKKNKFVTISHIDYTTNSPKVMSTYIPKDRPTFKEWVTEMKINELSWSHSPDGKTRAQHIMSGVGVKPEATIMDQILGRDVMNPERFV